MSESRPRLIGVQAGRGVAALLVVLYHAERSLALPQYVGHAPLGGAFAFGHAGVDFFFVLSGFIIMFVHRADLGRPERLGRYLWNRVTRIYPMYWVATALVLAQLVLAHPDRIQAGGLIRSVLLLPQTDPPVLGVGWTLEHEVLFYAAFGVAILRPAAGWLLAVAAVLLVVASGALGWTGLAEILGSTYHLQFLAGIGCAVLVQSGRVPAPRTLCCLGVAAFLAAGIAEDAGAFDPPGPLGRLLFGAASAAVLIGVATAEQRGTLRFGALAATLGAASYVIYLLHEMVLNLITRGLFAAGLGPALPGWAVLVVAAAAAVAIAVLVHWTIEVPLMRAIRAPRRPAAVPLAGAR